MTEGKDITESPISDSAKGLPRWFKWTLGVGSGLLLFFSLCLYLAYLFSPDRYAAPSDLQLGSLILFSSSVLILVIAPWEELGVRINRIGPIEFDRVISEQARENVGEFAELRQRIDKLEKSIDKTARIPQSEVAVELRPLIIRFMERYAPTPYSPLRILHWGSRQEGFEELSNYDLRTIRKVLQDLVSEDILTTRVSRTGVTLYKMAG